MTFWAEFRRTFAWRPGLALGALYWHITRRRLRARNWLRKGAQTAPYAYAFWTETVEDNVATLAAADSRLQRLHGKPRFTVLLHITPDSSTEWIEAASASIQKQCYLDWEMLIVAPKSIAAAHGSPHPQVRIIYDAATSDCEAINIALKAASGDYFLPVYPGSILPPTALLRYAEALQDAPDAVLLYGDHDRIGYRSQRSTPWFKPQFNAEMLFAQDYISQAFTIKTSLARSLQPLTDAAAGAAAYDLLLRASETGHVVHVPHVTSHLSGDAANSNLGARLAAVADRIAGANAVATPAAFDTVKVTWPLPDHAPLVSIIIPTRDKVGLLKACLDSVVAKTTYPRFEVIVIDNGSTDAETHAYFSAIAKRPDVRILPFNKPYNYSEINNFAVDHANGEYVCLLNNDTEVISEDWLTELMRQAIRPDVGAVGAKLLFADRTIQHAGVVIGLGQAAGHAHRFQDDRQPGYFNQAHIAREVSAVTAACLVVQKQKFAAVGGLDAANLGIAYNDVDLCLKLGRAGWRNIYVPHAKLYHHESKSRGNDLTPQHVERYMAELKVLQDRWGTKSYVDPGFHVNLDWASETYTLRF